MRERTQICFTCKVCAKSIVTQKKNRFRNKETRGRRERQQLAKSHGGVINTKKRQLLGICWILLVFYDATLHKRKAPKSLFSLSPTRINNNIFSLSLSLFHLRALFSFFINYFLVHN